MIKQRKIFIGIGEIAGILGRLESGFTEAGVYAQFCELVEHPFAYKKITSVLFCQNIIRKINSLLKKNKKNKVYSIFLIFLRILFTGPLFINAIIKYNIFIFAGCSSFFKLKELWLLKLLKKKIVFIFFGSDSRPVYLNGRYFAGESAISNKRCFILTKKQKKNIRCINKWADVIIDNPASGIFHEKAIVPFYNIGIPIPEIIPEDMFLKEKVSFESVRILHAPSMPACKGTFIIRKEIDNLIKDGYKIDYIELSGVSFLEVQKEILKSDFIIDQLYSDTTLAGIAVEAATYGKPAVVCGYVEKTDFGVHEELIPPSEFVKPEDLKTAIIKLIEDKEYRILLGKKAEVFVKNRWNKKKVAMNLLSLIYNPSKKIKMYDPQQIRYIWGWGQTKEVLIKRLQEYIDKYGTSALFIDDKPELLELIEKSVLKENNV